MDREREIRILCVAVTRGLLEPRDLHVALANEGDLGPLQRLVQEARLPPEKAKELEKEFERASVATISLKDDALRDEDGELPPPVPLAGTSIAHYRLEQLLGQGGMGLVYRAFDTVLKRPVALKLLRPGAGHSSLRFLKEAQAQARVEHEGICRVYEAGFAMDRPFIAMQYVGGGTLDDVTGMSLEEKVRVIKDVAEALHAAHRAGLIHRDVKPQNILIETAADGTRRTFVTDFGLARDLGAGGLTATGNVVGTPHFMAPEQARGDSKNLDRRTDVYSLGVTFYKVLSDEFPFSGSSAMDIMIKLVSEEPEPLARKVPGVPRDLETIVMKCLEKDPAKRYDSARALAEDLQRFLDGEPLAARPVSFSERVVRRFRRHTAVASVGAAGLLAVMVLGILYGRSRLLEGERTRAATRFGEEVRQVESVVRIAALLPRHDTSEERRFAEACIEKIEREMQTLGKSAQAAGRYSIARAYMSLGRWEMAREHLERATTLGYSGPDLDYASGLTLGELYREALTEANRITNKEQRERRLAEIDRDLRQPAGRNLERGRSAALDEPSYAEGLLAFYSGDHDGALARLAATVGRRPGFFEAWKARGDVLMARAADRRSRGEDDPAAADIADARTAYRQSLEIARSYGAAWAGLCGAEYAEMELGLRRGQAVDRFREAAISACKTALEVEPGLFNALAALARLHARSAEALFLRGEDPSEVVSQSASAAREAIAQNPRRSSPHASLGFAYRVKAEYESRQSRDPRQFLDLSLESYARAAELEPSAAVFSNLGILHAVRAEYEMQQGLDPKASLERAVKAHEKAIALDPKALNSYINLSNAFRIRGDAELATGKDSEPSFSAAVDAALKATGLGTSSAIAFNNLANAYQRRGEARLSRGEDPREDFQKAIEAAVRTVELNPAYTYGHGNLGSAYLLLGSFEMLEGRNPLPLLEKAEASQAARLRLEPTSGRAHAALGKIWGARFEWAARNGPEGEAETAEARRHFARSRELRKDFVEGLEAEAGFELTRAEVLRERKRSVTRELEAAGPLIDRGLELNPREATLWLHRARLATLRADEAGKSAAEKEAILQAGLEAVGKATEVNPTDPESLLRKGALLTRLGAVKGEGRLVEQGRRLEEEAVRRNRFLASRVAKGSKAPVRTGQR